MNVSGVLTSLVTGFAPSTPQEAVIKQREKLFRQLSDLHSAKGNSVQKAEMAKLVMGMTQATEQQLQTQVADQYKAAADAQQKLLDSTEDTLIQSAKKQKDDGVLVSASLRRIMSADYKYKTMANASGGQMVNDMAEDIRKDLTAANKLGVEAAEIARRKRQEQFKTDLNKAAKLKQAAAKKQKAIEVKAEEKEAELEKAKAKAETAELNARKRKRKPINVTV